MRSFRDKFPGLTEEQIRIKYKIWEREKQREIELLESLKRKIPFKFDEGDDDTGDYGFGGDLGFHGFVSDAAIKDSTITFIYPDGLTKTTATDHEGGFDTPIDFKEGDILVKGGTDTVTGMPFIGEFLVDAEFFFKYKSITPLTHVANQIWLNTDTKKPEEALDLLLNNISEFTGIPLSEFDKDHIFCNDPVKLSFQGVRGAKEVQAINTFLEVHTELMSNTEANLKEEIEENKKKSYLKISSSLLDKINGVSSKSLIQIDDMNVDSKYKECFYSMLNKASDLILEHLSKDHLDATTNIQALNLAVKKEWVNKAFEMTTREDIDSDSIWNEIENKSTSQLLKEISVPV
jgi:hypothetical protein